MGQINVGNQRWRVGGPVPPGIRIASIILVNIQYESFIFFVHIFFIIDSFVIFLIIITLIFITLTAIIILFITTESQIHPPVWHSFSRGCHQPLALIAWPTQPSVCVVAWHPRSGLVVWNPFPIVRSRDTFHRELENRAPASWKKEFLHSTTKTPYPHNPWLLQDIVFQGRKKGNSRGKRPWK